MAGKLIDAADGTPSSVDSGKGEILRVTQVQFQKLAIRYPRSSSHDSCAGSECLSPVCVLFCTVRKWVNYHNLPPLRRFATACVLGRSGLGREYQCES